MIGNSLSLVIVLLGPIDLVVLINLLSVLLFNLRSLSGSDVIHLLLEVSELFNTWCTLIGIIKKFSHYERCQLIKDWSLLDFAKTDCCLACGVDVLLDHGHLLSNFLSRLVVSLDQYGWHLQEIQNVLVSVNDQTLHIGMAMWGLGWRFLRFSLHDGGEDIFLEVLQQIVYQQLNLASLKVKMEEFFLAGHWEKFAHEVICHFGSPA